MRSCKSQVSSLREISYSQRQSYTSPELRGDRLNLFQACTFDVGAFLACAVCGGAHSTSPLAQGMNWGIFTLMAFIGTVLAGIALFFVHIVRKEDAAANPPPPGRPVDL